MRSILKNLMPFLLFSMMLSIPAHAEYNPLLDYEFIENATVEEIIKEIKAGVDVNGKDKNGRASLYYAARYNQNPAIIETLIAHGADVNDKDKILGATSLYYAALNNQNPAIIETLIAHGADVNAKTEYGSTPLHNAAENQNPDIIETLIAHGADVDAETEYGDTPLLSVIYNNPNSAVAEALIANGADVNVMDNNHKTPLFYALEFTFNRSRASPNIGKSKTLREIIEILLKHGAKTDGTYEPFSEGDSSDTYPIVAYVIDSCRYEELQPLKLLKILVKYGADIHNTKYKSYIYQEVEDWGFKYVEYKSDALDDALSMSKEYPSCLAIAEYVQAQRQLKE